MRLKRSVAIKVLLAMVEGERIPAYSAFNAAIGSTLNTRRAVTTQPFERKADLFGRGSV